MPKRYWLMKTEPDVFSFDDLMKSPKRRTFWEGVRNYQARNFMRDQFQVGDLALIYHSNADPTGIFGVAEVVKAGYADPAAFDPKSPYYDEKAHGKKENPWIRVDIEARMQFNKPLTRDDLRSHLGLREMLVLQKGSRLSIQPVTAKEFQIILSLGEPEKL